MGRRRIQKPRTNWTQIPKENSQWEAYYREQGILSPEEFPAFKAACQADLPLTFRITGSGSSRHTRQIRNMMESRYISHLSGLEFEGRPIKAPVPLSWYPENLAWQVEVGKQVIRKNPQFAQFQRFLVVETEVGNISRQEAVSMIPPLFLDVQPQHSVLDTCASPGSKTVQLLEALHSKGAMEATGFVVANDSDYKRSHMLTHQIKRLGSANAIVTNHDAQMYPNIHVPGGILKFDRILCDVPCSGDGTMRKNYNVWRDWTVGNGLGLHSLQINITARSVQMLNPGGRLVYSTCSLNPIEDEAVVAQILRKYPQMHLVDVSSDVTSLNRKPGLKNWRVQTKDGKWHEKPEDRLARSLFPPSEDEEYNLEHCMRVYPHQQDTGGFFIAVLEKDANSESKRVKVSEPSQTEPEQEVKSSETSKPMKLPRDVPQSDEPFHFLDPHHEVVEKCWKFYGISDDFPRDTLVVRNQTGEPVRTIYYVAPSVRPIIENNTSKIKFVHSGIKLFNQQKGDGPCNWRVQSEGLPMLYPFAQKRVVRTRDIDTLRWLCVEEFPRLDLVKHQDPELYGQTDPLEEGCCFWEVEGAVYPLWRGKASLNIMTGKEATAEILFRLFGIDVKKKPETSAPNSEPAEENEKQGNEEKSG